MPITTPATPFARSLRRVLCGVGLALLWLIGGSGPSGVPLAGAQAAGNVGLVIAYGPGQVTEYCFSVAAAGIGGLELLQRAGVPVRSEIAGGLGAEICAVNGVGCLDTGQPCYCQCQGSPCVFWHYSQWRNGRWVGSNLGASSTVVRPGSIEGWAWGGNPPAPVGAALCATTAAPSPSPPPILATPTPRPPTRTALPTRTPRPTLPPTIPPRPTVPPTRALAATIPATELPLPTIAATGSPSALLPSTAAPPTLTATALPTDTPLPTETATTLPTDTLVPTDTPVPTSAPATDTPAPPIPTATTQPVAVTSSPKSERRTQNAELPTSYWLFGVLAVGLLGLIGWARRGR